MGIFSDKPKTDEGVIRGRLGNGHARDTSNPDGVQHAAALGPHQEAVNDLRSGGGTAGRHRRD